MDEPPVQPADATPPTGGGTGLYAGVADLYHAFLTGLLLMVVSRRGSGDAAELVFRTFRRQHLEKFLPGLAKLGLTDLPHAVACARYHYLSNHLGGVKVEYFYESDTKAWIRYPPPRWIFEGTAICGIPSEVSRAMLRGWHAHNGVSLGNRRLGFVCTGQTVDGQAGLEGYYIESHRDLEPDERLRFAPDEAAPADATPIARLDATEWPEERLHKVLRNYAMDYIRTILPLTIEIFGPAEGRSLAGLAARQIGMHWCDKVAASTSGEAPGDFLDLLARLLGAQGDTVRFVRTASGRALEQQGWRLFRGMEAVPREVFEAWSELWQGLLLGLDRHGRLVATRDAASGTIRWSLA